MRRHFLWRPVQEAWAKMWRELVVLKEKDRPLVHPRLAWALRRWLLLP